MRYLLIVMVNGKWCQKWYSLTCGAWGKQFNWQRSASTGPAGQSSIVNMCRPLLNVHVVWANMIIVWSGAHVHGGPSECVCVCVLGLWYWDIHQFPYKGRSRDKLSCIINTIYRLFISRIFISCLYTPTILQTFDRDRDIEPGSERSMQSN